MVRHASAVRQHRRSVRKNVISGKNKAAFRTQVKKLREAIQQQNKEAAKELLPQTVSLIDQSVKKGTIHKNKGSRFKSRLSRQVELINPAPSK